MIKKKNLGGNRMEMNEKNCRVSICNPSPEELGYEPNESNTINL